MRITTKIQNEMRLNTVLESLFLIDWAWRNYETNKKLQDSFGRPISTRDVLIEYARIFKNDDIRLHINSANKRLKFLKEKRLIKISAKSWWFENSVNVYELAELGKSTLSKYHDQFVTLHSQAISKLK